MSGALGADKKRKRPSPASTPKLAAATPPTGSTATATAMVLSGSSSSSSTATAVNEKENVKHNDKSYCSSNVQSVVFPGDTISLKPDTKIRLGAGLTQHKDNVVSSKCGILRQIGANKLWVDNMQKRYIPTAEDMVVGVVIEKHGESYRIDINSTQPARLPALAFEGASKRNKPNIPVGALVYCRVAVANKDMETELTCVSPHLKKDWVTGETLFGELAGGYCFKTSLSLARKLLEEDCAVLRCLGTHIPFELAIGANGQVWIKSGAPLHTVVISNAILNSENLSETLIETMVTQLIKNVL